MRSRGVNEAIDLVFFFDLGLDFGKFVRELCVLEYYQPNTTT